ncbi:nitrate- and nitrite sensing domain-containing protein [Streptosporangium sp. NPDC004379]|uniref:sensor histidine kinase n=1 Tax=Streptosporangium sp. NPDC004379 TaxID=3366189 RepID=UPI0036CE531E
MGDRKPSIKVKIFTLLLVPIVSLVAIWGFAAALTLQSGLELLRTGKGYEYGVVPTRALTTTLQHERLLSLAYLGGSGSRAELDAQRSRTNAARAELERLTPLLEDNTLPAVWERIGRLRTVLDRLTEIRSGVDTRTATRLATLDAYNALIGSAFDSYSKINSADPVLADQTRAVVMVGRSREMLSQQAALISGAVASKTMTAAERTRFGELASNRRLLYSLGFDQFDTEFRELYRKLEDSPAYVAFGRVEHTALAGGRPDSFWAANARALSDSFDELGGQASRRLTERSGPVATGILVRIGVAGGLGLVAVAFSVFISVRFGGRLAAELGGLQRAALDLAHRRLPDVVERLRKGEDVCSEVRELDHGTTAEVANVGRAFSSVQRTAIEAAVGQAELRRAVNKVFVNLARRSQSLLHRQLAMLEAMEKRAGDPDTLEDLFAIDHLTTRMRRHSEGLIILSGAAPGRGWRTPVMVYDVVRAAVEEVEDYRRVTVAVPPGPCVLGTVATDVIHLVAELVENAAAFSPPNTTVRVGGEVVARGYTIEVEDRGLGMTPEEMAGLNERLAGPPEFDLAGSDRLGLFVVTQLAARHGIRVTLRPSPFGGTTAIVLLPNELMAEPSAPRAAHLADAGRLSPGGLPRRVRRTAPALTAPATTPSAAPAPPAQLTPSAQPVPSASPVPSVPPATDETSGPVTGNLLTSFRNGWHRAEQEKGVE